MKVLVLCVSMLTAFSYSYSQTSRDGDDLNLMDVLELFKDSDSMEEFENALNSSDNPVNNLDLNDDGKVDYIQVIDQVEGNVNTLILRVPMNETEFQDVAVIELEKLDDHTSVIQIIGDEDLYGENYIVEPISEVSSEFKNVHAWKSVAYLHGPRYKTWKSPFRYGVYPSGFILRNKLTRANYISRVSHHRAYYRQVNHYRSVKAHAFYTRNRKVSTHYKNRHRKEVHNSAPVKNQKRRNHHQKHH